MDCFMACAFKSGGQWTPHLLKASHASPNILLPCTVTVFSYSSVRGERVASGDVGLRHTRGRDRCRKDCFLGGRKEAKPRIRR